MSEYDNVVNIAKINDDVLIRCYVIIGVAVDQLPYSPELNRIVISYRQQTGYYLASRTAFQRLLNFRKSGKLPTLKPHNKLDELYVAAGRIPARFCKLWSTKDAAIYKGRIEWYKPTKGEFVGMCDFATSACHIVKEHNDTLFEMWAKEDARVHSVTQDLTPFEVSCGVRRPITEDVDPVQHMRGD